MNVNDFLKFAKKVGSLKRVKRTGWIREGIRQPESIADHSFRLIVLTMILAPHLRVSKNKLVKMAIIHDLAEGEIGDIVWKRGKKIYSKLGKDKEERELKVIEEMFGGINLEYVELFKELIARKTKEAKLVWQLDKLEMAIQAHEYENEQKKDLREFFENASINIREPLLRSILKLLK